MLYKFCHKNNKLSKQSKECKIEERVIVRQLGNGSIKVYEIQQLTRKAFKWASVQGGKESDIRSYVVFCFELLLVYITKIMYPILA